MTPPSREPACRTCRAALRRCWVCGEVVRCVACQQCLRCEGLLDEAGAGALRTIAPLTRVPSVRLKRGTAVPRPRPAVPTPSAGARARARRVAAPAAVPRLPPLPNLGDAVWYVRAAVVPALMLLAAYWCHGYFRSWSGLWLALACVGGFYLPYLALTPVRRNGQLFPLGEEGPGLPVVMVVGGALVGGVCGIALGVFAGQSVGLWGGMTIAVVTFHGIYYATVVEKYRATK